MRPSSAVKVWLFKVFWTDEQLNKRIQTMLKVTQPLL